MQRRRQSCTQGCKPAHWARVARAQASSAPTAGRRLISNVQRLRCVRGLWRQHWLLRPPPQPLSISCHGQPSQLKMSSRVTLRLTLQTRRRPLSESMIALMFPDARARSIGASDRARASSSRPSLTRQPRREPAISPSGSWASACVAASWSGGGSPRGSTRTHACNVGHGALARSEPAGDRPRPRECGADAIAFAIMIRFPERRVHQ